MTIPEFKKIARLLKETYAELEKEAIKIGLSFDAPKFKDLMDQARLKVVETNGFTLKEYQEVKSKMETDRQLKRDNRTTNLIKEIVPGMLVDPVKALEAAIPSKEDIHLIAHEVAKEYIKPPQITNQIIKETVVEKPQIIKETKVEQITQRVEYDATSLTKEISLLKEGLAQIPEPVDVVGMVKKSEDVMWARYVKHLKENINVLGMPDFRKLGMGLQAQIDANTTALSLKAPLASPTFTGTLTSPNFTLSSPQTYTITNVSTDRSYDANSTTLDELADALGTLIADLRAAGLIL